MAASTPSRWTAVHITSLQRAGFLHSSRKRHLGPHLTVFGHVSPRLTHQPDRRDVGRLTDGRPA